MRILITGGSGFIGSTIANRLVCEGHDVVILDREEPGKKGLPVDAAFVSGDVRDGDLLRGLFDGVDEIYHLSGLLGTAELQARIPDAVDINITSTARVFEIATLLEVPRVFYPVKPTIWLNAYTITKYAAEQFAQMFNERGVTKICALRYFNVYGPGQAILPVRKIVPAFAIQAMRGMPIEVFGNGEQTVDMCYSDDIAEMTIRFTRSGHTETIPDCGSGTSMTVNQVADTVNEYFENSAGIKHIPMRPGETPDSELAADLSDIHRVLGEAVVTPYEEALATTLDWYARVDPALQDEAIRFFGWGEHALV